MRVEAALAEQVGANAIPWWESRLFLACVVLATMAPLIYPPIPPMVDVLGHIGRYRVELDLQHSPWLQQYYDYHWAPIGNLGVDLLVLPLGRLLGLEVAVKLIVLAIPPITAIGLLWIAFEIHGRIPPTAFFALPFIYSFPFLYGFLNFALSFALACLAFAFWLRLGRLGQTTLRSWLFAPGAVIIFFCHVYGWGLLGLMCFSAEAMRLRDGGRSWRQAGMEAALYSSVMVLPLLIMLLWENGSNGTDTLGWFDWQMKWRWTYATLRDRWGVFDMASLAFVSLILVYAVASPKLRVSRNLAFSVTALTALFLIMPNMVFGSAYADMRVVPCIFALSLLSICLTNSADMATGRFLAIIATFFFVFRITANTASLAIAAVDQKEKLQAIEWIPRGARVASFYGLPHPEPWALPRNSHLGALVIARREGFSNDQWMYAGHNLLVLKYREPAPFVSDPSEVVRPNGPQPGGYRTIQQALAAVPRDKFDYIWLIDISPIDSKLVEGLQPVWRTRSSALYSTRAKTLRP